MNDLYIHKHSLLHTWWDLHAEKANVPYHVRHTGDESIGPCTASFPEGVPFEISRDIYTGLQLETRNPDDMKHSSHSDSEKGKQLEES